jgi:putative flippase GtrA
MRKVIDYLIANRGEAIRYVLVGGCTAFINLSTYAFMYKTLGIYITVSNIISILLSILFAYVANKLFVFRSHCRNSRELLAEFVKFVSGRLITMVLEVAGVFLLVNIIGQNAFWGKLETQIIVITGNFVVSKYLVFVNPEKAKVDRRHSLLSK